MCAAGNDLRSCRFIALFYSVIRVSIFLDDWPIYLCEQSLQGIMLMSFFVSVVVVLSLCFVKMN